MDLLMYFFTQIVAGVQDPFLWPVVLGGYVLRRHATVAVIGGLALGLGCAFFLSPMDGKFTLETDLFWAARALAGGALACLGLSLACWKIVFHRLRAAGRRCGALWLFLKKRCPICAEHVDAETEQCLYCGYLFVK